MKKLVFLLLGLCFLLACDQQRFDKRFTLSTKSTKPYDIKFIYDQIEKQAGELSINKEDFELNPLFDNSQGLDAYVAVTRHFYPHEYDISLLKSFVAQGNVAFIASFDISDTFKDSLLYFVEDNELSYFPPDLYEDSLQVNWFKDSSSVVFKYPGHFTYTDRLDSAYILKDNLVVSFDTLITTDSDLPVVLRLNCGLGKIYLCDNPLILSNYFLLHKDNFELINLLSRELGLDYRSVIWDDFYKNKLDDNEDDRSPVWEIISKYPALLWAFGIVLFGGLLYILMYARRDVQQVTFIKKEPSKPLAFSEALAGVYWSRKDHNSIAKKLFQQFFEYLYLQHHVSAEEVKKGNLTYISTKIGKPKEQLEAILQELVDYNHSHDITEVQLERYYFTITKFYNS